MTDIVMDLPADDASAANQGARDCSLKWNDYMRGLREGDTAKVPPGYCAMKSPLLAPPNGVEIVGSGTYSHLVRCFNQNASETFLPTGIIDASVKKLKLWTADGFGGGRMIGRHATSPADAPYGTIIEHVIITAFNTGWADEGVHLDGVLGKEQYGMRRVQCDAITISGVRGTALWIGGAVSSQFTRIIAGAGSPQLSVFCVGVPRNPNNQLSINGPIDGVFVAYHTVASDIRACTLSQVYLDPGCSGTEIEAAYLSSNSPSLSNGPNNHCYANGNHWESTPSGTRLVP